MLPYFEQIISIELGEDLFGENVLRFAGEPGVSLLHGDSGSLLPAVVASLSSPALFWLDGHHSEGQTARGDQDTPIRQELMAIAASPVRGHVVLIDDARAFGSESDYPSIAQVGELVDLHLAGYRLSVKSDIIRIEPDGRR